MPYKFVAERHRRLREIGKELRNPATPTGRFLELCREFIAMREKHRAFLRWRDWKVAVR
jgi:hypothetical protein